MNFESEGKNGEFSLCCHKGKVNLAKHRELPADIKSLFTGESPESKEFLNNIRRYNSALAFASMNAKIDSKVNKSGTFVFRISGQVYHQTSSYLKNHIKGSFSQLYILDSQEATDKRMAHECNVNCNPEVIVFFTII